jgi:hypothetical protein
MDAQGTAPGGQPALPGEHGFGFFSGFYQHITDTVNHIPSGPDKTVEDPLVPATRILMAQAGKRNELIAPVDFPATIPDFAFLAQFMWDFAFQLRISPVEVTYFMHAAAFLGQAPLVRRAPGWSHIQDSPICRRRRRETSARDVADLGRLPALTRLG